MDFENRAKIFIQDLPYKCQPYQGRNWGHPWHSLCSYHGKLKPAIAHFLVKEFSKEGDIVLDPLCGVGTIPFEACLQGRTGIGNDLSKLAFLVTKAKIEMPHKSEVGQSLSNLETFINENKFNFPEECKKYSGFGFNGKITEYYHEDTYREVICAREYFKQRADNLSPADALVAATLLHVLHGNRPYALSRNSHPLTPYAPSGEYIYKNLISHVTNKIEASYKKGEWDGYTAGKAIQGDFNDLNLQKESVDVIISSPPFTGSLRFYMSNWLRLWFIGWEPQDYIEADKLYLEGKQKRDMDIYNTFFEICQNVLKPGGKMILHLGKTKKCDMAEELSVRAKPWFDEVFRGAENVEELEKHGIKDKGVTLEHQYLFLQKK